MRPSDQRAMMAELAAEIPPHLRRVQTAAQSIPDPVRDALTQYETAGLRAMLALQREQLGVTHE